MAAPLGGMGALRSRWLKEKLKPNLSRSLERDEVKLNQLVRGFPHLTLPSPRRVPIALAQWEPDPRAERDSCTRISQTGHAVSDCDAGCGENATDPAQSTKVRHPEGNVRRLFLHPTQGWRMLGVNY